MIGEQESAAPAAKSLQLRVKPRWRPRDNPMGGSVRGSSRPATQSHSKEWTTITVGVWHVAPVGAASNYTPQYLRWRIQRRRPDSSLRRRISEISALSKSLLLKIGSARSTPSARSTRRPF